MFLILLSTNLEVELLDHLVTLFLTFLENAKQLSKTSALDYIPTSNICGFQFLHLLLISIIVLIIDLHFKNRTTIRQAILQSY